GAFAISSQVLLFSESLCYSSRPKQVLLLARRLLLGHRHSSRPLTGASVCVSTLSSHRQPASVSESAIAADVHHSLDVHLSLLSQIAFDHSLRVDDVAYAVHLVLAKLLDSLIDADAGFAEYLVRPRTPYAINVCEPDLRPLVRRQVHARNACHSSSVSPVAV